MRAFFPWALQTAKLSPASCPPNLEREVAVSVPALSSLTFCFSVMVLIVRTSGQQLPVSALDAEHMINWCLGHEGGMEVGIGCVLGGWFKLWERPEEYFLRCFPFSFLLCFRESSRLWSRCFEQPMVKLGG